MPELSIIRDFILILLTAFFGGIAAKSIRQPLMIGFLLGGMVIGILWANVLPNDEAIKMVAELGVALLLFTLGLEFSITRIKELGEIIISASLIQVLFTIIVAVLVFPLFGLDFYTALFLGVVFSLSSTAVTVKTLADRGELDSLHGEIASGWLFMQDLYTLPLIIILPAIAKISQSETFAIVPIMEFVKSLFLSFSLFFLIVYVGKKIMPYIFEKIADFKSRELVLIAAVATCLIFAYIFRLLGFSTALGAFVAGILLSSSSVNHGIFAEVRPLRDLFSTVFFVSLGFLINPAFLLFSWKLVIFLTFLVIFIKFVISTVLVILLGYHTKTATMVGLSLVSVGEFAFVLALLGLTSNLISQEIYMTILSVSFLTLVFSVPILAVSEKLYYQLKKLITKNFPRIGDLINRFDRERLVDGQTWENHVVVLGHGRVGKYICRALSLAEIPYMVVDYNHHLVKHLEKEGLKAIYGDPTDIEVLRFARVDAAKVVIMAYADRYMQGTVIANVLTLNPKVKLICRTHFEEDQNKLRSFGVSMVVQPEFEAATSMAEIVLKIMHSDLVNVEEKLKRIRKEYGWH